MAQTVRTTAAFAVLLVASLAQKVNAQVTSEKDENEDQGAKTFGAWNWELGAGSWELGASDYGNRRERVHASPAR